MINIIGKLDNINANKWVLKADDTKAISTSIFFSLIKTLKKAIEIFSKPIYDSRAAVWLLKQGLIKSKSAPICLALVCVSPLR